MNLLIAEDSDGDRMILATLLRRLGHQVHEASNGLEAVAVFVKTEPDIVFMDALMPTMSGMDAARRIKELSGTRFVPVVFITSLASEREQARCLEAGGDDFLLKPYSRVILEAKINAYSRVLALQHSVVQQRNQIRQQNEQMLAEQRMARRVFDNVAHTGCLDAANIRYHASPLSIFNGDVLFAAERPGGGTLIFLGDFTGHGLPAAIGAMPIAEVFYGMVAKGFGAIDLLAEINKKLGNILPVGMFCCGALVETDGARGTTRVWNGGLPDGWLVRNDGELVAVPSRHLPLGVQPPERFDATMELLNTAPDDYVVLMTDGFPESCDAQGESLGEDAVRQVLSELQHDDHPFEALMARLQAFTGHPDPADDITLCCLKIVAQGAIADVAESAPESALTGPGSWHCVYELRDQALADFNPLPLLLHICTEVPGLRRRSGEVFTLLSELYSNALEHGVLKLSSEWKKSAKGFSLYYEERTRRLSDTQGHYIRFTLDHEPLSEGGRLKIRCEDSGQGFDMGEGNDSPRPIAGKEYHGRGMGILKRMARAVSVCGSGNCVEIVYDWEFPMQGCTSQ
ncbi:SpoIIE family protein phosphatase [Marinobacter litoralis]|uniref:ATP-binding SpoIIE family protein phosphatase n=1 Tax=Marinobacter litoralis TaxID=187981 RepID=UPI0018EC2862|nr:fused response regulator/phosphatase [Marinobacter litoralis]MBJ6137412.1 fused response regulator/phosphatase [Marinobacter litoralis]